MVLFAAFMMWAYSWTEYVVPGRKTSIWRPLWDSINFSEALSYVQEFTCLSGPQRILLSKYSGLSGIISTRLEASLGPERYKANRIYGQGMVWGALGERWILLPRLGYTSPAPRPTDS